MLAVTAYPIGYAVWLSLQRYDLRFPADRQFIGLANYVTVLGDRLWWTAFGVTLFITVVSVAVELVLGMGLALIMRWALVGGKRCGPRSSSGSSPWSPPTAGSTPGRRAPGIWPTCCRRAAPR